MNSPGRFNRGGGLSTIPEVKSGIFLSELRGGANDPIRKKAPLKVVRTKSGNFKKAMLTELESEKEDPGEAGTRVTSSYARVLLAGSGFLADAYDLFVINLVLRLLRNEYPEYDNNTGGMSLYALEGGVAAAALFGSIIGQLVAGSLADVIGRKKIFVTTAVLISIGSFGSACSQNMPYLTVYGCLAAWRFVLGVGVGGEYPLAATVTSESSSAARRGALMAAVFSMQGVGSLLSVFIVICCLSLGLSDGFTWRFALAFGALPVLVAFPFRLRMHETETFKRVKAERQVLETLNKETQEVISMYTEGNNTNYGSINSEGVSGANNTGGSGKYKKKHAHDGSVGSGREPMMQLVTDFVVHDDYSPAVSNHNTTNNNSNTNGNNNTTINNTTNNNHTTSGTSGVGGDSVINRFSPHAGSTTHHNAFPSPLLTLPHITNPVSSTDADTTANTTANTTSSNNTPTLPTTTNTNTTNTTTNNNTTNTTTTTLTNNMNTTTIPTPSVLPPTRMNELNKAFKYYKYHMLGTALCWFLLDIDFYANGLFNHEITSSIFSVPGHRNTALQDAYYSGILSIIALPGYWLSVLYIDTVGRKNLQMIGFFCMAMLFFTCSLCYEWLMEPEGGMYRKYLFLVIYALTFLFSNFGPNTTSFVIPGEIFPAEVRATCHGISAACGKLGAATGAFLFPMLLGPGGASAPTTEGIQYTMLVCGLVALLGVGVTYLFTPTYDASMLVQEGTYLALDHAFLRPRDEDLMLLDGYECVEVDDVESSGAGTGGGSGYGGGYSGNGGGGGSSKYRKQSPSNMQHVISGGGYSQIQDRDELY